MADYRIWDGRNYTVLENRTVKTARRVAYEMRRSNPELKMTKVEKWDADDGDWVVIGWTGYNENIWFESFGGTSIDSQRAMAIDSKGNIRSIWY